MHSNPLETKGLISLSGFAFIGLSLATYVIYSLDKPTFAFMPERINGYFSCDTKPSGLTR